ncbi:helix-turn-helix domain-containing protein [Kitasatospora indigofera]|uniref:helix-turn-helix domain-containing protein n=1 Tax=Kitasatospora indigofera TaxID=67307 RepID=UPI0036C67F2B
MAWQATPRAREAARCGDYGSVIREAREAQRITQRDLAEACGTSQTRVSRQLEGRGVAGPYPMDLLRLAAARLDIPMSLVGLAEHAASGQGQQPVQRRDFLGGAAAMAAAPLLAPFTDARDASGQQAAALRLSTSAYRRLDPFTPSRDLAEAVQAHLRLIQTRTSAARVEQRQRLAEVASEASSFAGWLAWDMGDSGSARTWYGQSIKAARASGNGLLAAYQTGSLAQFEAHAGNSAASLSLTTSARRLLGGQVPEIADAWLSATEALGHAAAGDERECERALLRSRAAAARVRVEESPPWPWVFVFDEAKVEGCRITCGAILGRPEWVLAADSAALRGGHAKQRALVDLDVATAHLAAGRVETAFSFAGRAVDTGLEYRSGRIIERARALRRALTVPSPPKAVRQFDERLHGVYL